MKAKDIYFVTAIDTDSGKTLVCSILCEMLHADYWKPVQAGLPHDTEIVQSLVSNSVTDFHRESYLLNTPASPHAAAKIDGVEINIGSIKLPDTNNSLIIEGAGGCLVPLNDSDFVIDIASRFSAKIILVADLYLGSINHTLLTANLLKRKKLPVHGIIFNGESNAESERIILYHSGYRCLLRIKKEIDITRQTVAQYALELKKNWYE